jgi:phytoene dehydrogenase-like protein
MTTATRYDRFRRLDQDRFDVVIVGAGMGGLTAGALLAQRGRSVLVLDQHYVPGGNATIFKRPGYEFDVGVHYLGQCGPDGILPRILHAAGAKGVRFGQMDPDGFDTLLFDGLEFRVPMGVDAYRDRLVQHFPSERAGIDRYVGLLSTAAELQRAAQKPKRALSWSRSQAWGALKALRWADSTLGRFLDTCSADPLLRAVLAAENGTYAEPPSRASLVLHLGLMLHYLENGGYYPLGGGQVPANALADSIESSGGKLLLSTQVNKIRVQGGRAVGVEIANKHLGRRFVAAETVISNADVKKTLLQLVDRGAVSQATRTKAQRWEMAPALGITYLGVKDSVLGPRTQNTNYWVYPSTDIEGFYADAREGRMTEQPMVYATLASLKDPTNPRLAPPGVLNLQLMTAVPSQPSAWGVTAAQAKDGSYGEVPEYQARKAQFAERMRRGAARVFPTLDQCVVFEEVATPLTHTRYTGATGGTSYGLALIREQFLHRRPGAETEVPGLLLCGASMRTAHGILGAMTSGVVAAAQIAGRSVYRDAFGTTGAGEPALLSQPVPAELKPTAALRQPANVEAQR